MCQLIKFNDITLLIPTLNRPHCFNKVLEYYKTTDFAIIICKSSTYSNVFIANKYKVEYVHFQDTSFGKKMYQTTQKLKIKYVEFLTLLD